MHATPAWSRSNAFRRVGWHDGSSKPLSMRFKSARSAPAMALEGQADHATGSMTHLCSDLFPIPSNGGAIAVHAVDAEIPTSSLHLV